jgi:hypothetical protein
MNLMKKINTACEMTNTHKTGGSWQEEVMDAASMQQQSMYEYTASECPGNHSRRAPSTAEWKNLPQLEHPVST